MWRWRAGENNFTEPDSADYLQLADNLLATGNYGLNGIPEINRAPGYVFLILPLRWLFPGSLYPIVFLQIFNRHGKLLAALAVGKTNPFRLAGGVAGGCFPGGVGGGDSLCQQGAV